MGQPPSPPLLEGLNASTWFSPKSPDLVPIDYKSNIIFLSSYKGLIYIKFFIQNKSKSIKRRPLMEFKGQSTHDTQWLQFQVTMQKWFKLYFLFTKFFTNMEKLKGESVQPNMIGEALSEMMQTQCGVLATRN